MIYSLFFVLFCGIPQCPNFICTSDLKVEAFICKLKKKKEAE